MKISVRRADERGRARFDWLDSRHTFSFGNYYDPEHMGFGHLRVINEDRVAPGAGFGTHPHRDMEIISYVLDGALEHRDSMDNGSVIRPGDVQLMSAGSGVRHSEMNASELEPAHFLQIWIIPAERGTVPRYEQRHFSDEVRRGRLALVVSPDGADGSLTIGQDARLYAGLLDDGARASVDVASGRRAWIQVARGSVELGEYKLSAGDGAAVVDAESVELCGRDDAEVLVFDLS